MHLLLLWPTVPPPHGDDPARPLVAYLRAAIPTHPLLPLKPPARTPERRRLRTAPELETATEPHVSAPSLSTVSSVERSTTATPLRSEPAAPVPGASAAAAPAVPKPGDGLDAEGVRQYRLAVAREARRFSRYPESARAANLGGTVEIRVTVAAGGQPQDVDLARSSGYERLDAAALDMMKMAVPRTTVPELLRRHAFVVTLPVVFDLAND